MFIKCAFRISLKVFLNILFFVILLTYIPNTLYAQCTAFQLAYGGSKNERGYDIAATAGNAFFVAGITESFGNGKEVVISKHSSDGSLIWSKTYGFSRDESVRKITATADGGLLVVGQSISGQNLAGDILCFKVDASGQLIWSRLLGVGSTYGDLGMDIIETTDAGAAVSGILNVNGGIADMVVFKLNSAANVEWSKRFDRGDGEDGVGIVQIGDTLIVASDLQNSSAHYELQVMKLKISDGSFIKAKKLSPAARGLFNPYLIKNPFKPGYLISGHTIDFSSYANMKHTVIALDEDFNITNTTTININPVTNDYYTGLVALSDGSFITTAANQTNSDGYVVRVDKNNNVQFAQKLNKSTDLRLYRLMAMNSQLIAVGSVVRDNQEDMFITGFPIDGMPDFFCDAEKVQVSITQPTFTVSDFTWPSIIDVGLTIGIQPLTETGINLQKNDLCPPSPCDSVSIKGSSKICDKNEAVRYEVYRDPNCTKPFKVVFDASFGDIIEQTDTYFSVKYKKEGTTSLQVEYENNCKIVSSKFNVVVQFSTDGSCNTNACEQALKPDFDFTQDVCNPKSIRLSSSNTNMASYHWNFGNGQTVLGQDVQQIRYDDFGNFMITLSVESSGGCKGSVSKNVNVQLLQSDVIVTQDTSICLGDQFILRSNSSLIDFCWQPSLGVMNTNAMNPLVKPTANTIYTLTSKKLKSNLVLNGDFTAGNIEFQSDYLFSGSGIPEGVYEVSSNVKSWHGGLASCGDHTSQNGKMLLINGSGQKDLKVWYQTIKVTPNTNYVFSAWIQSLSLSNPAHLQFSINGNRIGNDLNASNQTCQWNRFYNTWNSGNQTTATIAIVNVNQLLMGNDFALDDIFFGEVVMEQESIQVNVTPIPNLQISKDTFVCSGTAVQLDASGAFQYVWSPSASLSATDIANPIAKPLQTTKYFLTGTNSFGCSKKDSIEIKVQPRSVFNITPANASICAGDTINFQATGGDLFQWTSDPSLISNSGKAMAFPMKTTTYEVFIKDNFCNEEKALSATIQVNPSPIVHVSKSNDIDCSNTTAQLVASGGTRTSWSPSSSLSNTNISNPLALPRQTTTYYVTVSSREGCTTKDSVTVQVTQAGSNRFYVPNAFTPDGNGKNDCFGVPYWGSADKFSLDIFNRWGEKVFSTNQITKCWDGKYNGQQQPIGVYVYIITAKTFCGDVVKKGTILLTR